MVEALERGDMLTKIANRLQSSFAERTGQGLKFG
jgi:hypothetical protein